MNPRFVTSAEPQIRQKLLTTALLVCLASITGVVAGIIASSGYLFPNPELNAWRAAAVVAGLLIMLPAAIWIVKNPEHGVLFLAAVVYANLSEIAVRNFSLPSLFQGIAGLLLLGLLVRAVRNGTGYFRLDSLLLLGGLYAVLILISSVYSTDPALSDDRFMQALRGLALAVLLVNLVRTPPQLDAILWVIIGGAAILATITIVQVATGSYHLNFGGLARIKNAQIVENVFEPRVAGPLSDPNFYAQILLIAVPMALFRFWEAKRLIFRVLIGAVLVLINVAIVFTYSRGALIAAGFVYLIAAVWMRVRPRHIISFALVAVLTIVIMPGDAAKRFDTLTQIFPWAETAEVKIDTSFQERTMLMRTAVEMFSDQPLLGVGAGNYTSNFDRYAPSVGSNVSSYEGFGKRRFPHNLYLETAAELGIAGLFVLIALISTGVVYAAVASRELKARGRWRTSRSSAAIAISIIGYGTTSLFLHGDYMQYLWMLVGLSIAAKQIAFDDTVEQDDLIGNAGASA